jgi:hypothetical protein
MDIRESGEFWMVWNPQGRAPTARHATEALAEAEASRLARQCHGQTFIVLRALYGVRVEAPPPPPVVRVSLDMIDLVPF